MAKILEGSRWFRRLIKDCRKISPHLRIKSIKLGFYRITWKGAYLHEAYKEMPQIGYDLDDLDPRFEDKKYFEEYEDNAELTRNIKNFVEGYYDSLSRIRTRVYMMRNDKEFNEKSTNAYKEFVVK